MKIFESNFIKTSLVSVNNCKQPIKVNGKFSYRKNDKYEAMIVVVLSQLDKIENIKTDQSYRIEYDFYTARTNSDVDNLIKCFQDILQIKYGVDDRNFYEVLARKFPVGKENEGVIFRLFEIKIPKIKNNFKLTKDKKIRGDCYED